MRSILLVSLLLSVLSSHAQNIQQGVIIGRLFDSTDNKPLGFATVQVNKTGGKEVIQEKLTNTDGGFELRVPYGSYSVRFNFIGYSTITRKNIIINEKNEVVNLGIVKIAITNQSLKEIVVQAEKSTMQLALDKKIFNVGKDLANAGGSASDILMNIPSVSVDPDGGVKLRGSDNVRILIDGKPSGLVSIKGAAGLQQLQANMVERVEIITNPSARYEAEGMAGIINIILKKDRRQGFNGSFELISGNPTNFGGAANVNYRKNKINFFINYGIAYRVQPYYNSTYQEIYRLDSTFITQQNNKGSFTGYNNNIRGGMDYFFNEKSVITAAYMYKKSKGKRLTSILYNDYLFTKNNLKDYVKRTQDEDEIEPYTDFTVDYKKTFAQKGHELSAEFKYLDYWENSDQIFTQKLFSPTHVEDLTKNIIQHSVNIEFEKQYLLQVDYTKPIGKEGKFETGLRSSLRNMVNDYLVAQKNVSGGFDPLPGFNNVFVYNENIHAAYGIYENKAEKLSYQLGLRAELTDVETRLDRTNDKNPRNYANLFPSSHFTYQLPNDHGLQISYSRRIRRPVYNDLSPYATFSDSRNFSGGNPNLNPEFSNVFELGHLKTFDKGSVSSSVYYRSTHGRIERIRYVDAAGNATTRPENLLFEKAYGVELTGGFKPKKWWKLDLNGNFFHANIDGSNILAAYKTATYSWFARQTSRFSLKNKLDIQIRTNYEAAQKTVQGKRKGMFYTDLSLSKDILKERGTVSLNVLDVFKTRKAKYIYNGANYHYDGYGRYSPTQVNLTFSYRIKQSTSAKKVNILKED